MMSKAGAPVGAGNIHDGILLQGDVLKMTLQDDTRDGRAAGTRLWANGENSNIIAPSGRAGKRLRSLFAGARLKVPKPSV
jgi:hypothetical protein